MSMSRYIKILLLSFLALTIACRKEMDPPSSAPEVQTVHYKATVQTEVGTRATLGDDLKYEFETGDRIYMESEDGKLYGFLSLSSDSGIGKNMALFEGDLSYVGEEPFQNNNPSVSLVLVGKNNELHTITDGKVGAVVSGSYLSDQWAPSLEEAVSRYSHFTGTGSFNDMRFTLQQQSSFLKCFVRMYKTQASVNRDISVQLLNNDVLLREATIKVSTAGSVPFVFAFLGDAVSLENAKLRLDWTEPGIGDQWKIFDDVSDKTLAANKYYSISRTTLAFDGFRIRSATSNSTTITFNDNYKNDIEYSPDFGEHWYSYAEPLTLDKDAVVCIKGNRENYMNNSGDEWGTPGANPIFTATSPCYISGNIMSLLKDEQLGESAFQGAFSKGKTALTNIDIDPDAPLILPATSLTPKCYMQMFRNCTSLTRVPVFRVETVKYRSCYNMFRDCSNLASVEGIELPATTLAEDCYREMFRLCKKITSVDKELLPATSLAVACYQQMFNGCEKLTNAPDLPATTLQEHCYDSMFSACTALTAAPELPATDLVESCYYQMFHSCNKLTEIKCRATSGINSHNSTAEWVKGITTTGTFYHAAGVEWPQGNHGYPSNWSLEDLP